MIRALTSAARTGVGYLIVRPTVIDRALNHQEPRIDSEGDPLRVVFDPFSQDVDGAGVGAHLGDPGELLSAHRELVDVVERTGDGGGRLAQRIR